MRYTQTFTDEQLKNYAKAHILYELTMLHETAALLAAYVIEGPYSVAVHNALMEFYSSHVRNLIDFLYIETEYEGARKTDVVVQDFVSDEKHLLTCLVSITPLLREARIKTGKQVSHLTSNRADEYVGDKKGWHFLAIYVDILKAFKSISDCLLPERVPDELLRFLDDHYVKVSSGIKIAAILKLNETAIPENTTDKSDHIINDT